MIERYEFSIRPEHIASICGSEIPPAVSHGESGLFERYRIAGFLGDEQYYRVGQLEKELSASSKKRSYIGWRIQRTFTKEEIQNASLFLIQFRYKHAAGEEFGTWYTDDAPNPNCGLERRKLTILSTSPHRSIIEDSTDIKCSLSSKRVGPLQLPYSELMKSHDIFALWGGEVIVAGKLAALITAGGFSGGQLLEISNTRQGSRSLMDLSGVPSGAELLRQASQIGLGVSDREYWHWLELPAQLPLLERALWEMHEKRKESKNAKSQYDEYRELRVRSSPLKISDDTLFGEGPFREARERCKCIFGEVRGNLLSQISVDASTWDGSDICQTDVFFGGRRGLFRPLRHLVVSRRLFDGMREAGIKAFDFEIVKLNR